MTTTKIVFAPCRGMVFQIKTRMEILQEIEYRFRPLTGNGLSNKEKLTMNIMEKIKFSPPDGEWSFKWYVVQLPSCFCLYFVFAP